jgi:hypothetical protein
MSQKWIREKYIELFGFGEIAILLELCEAMSDTQLTILDEIEPQLTQIFEWPGEPNCLEALRAVFRYLSLNPGACISGLLLGGTRIWVALAQLVLGASFELRVEAGKIYALGMKVDPQNFVSSFCDYGRDQTGVFGVCLETLLGFDEVGTLRETLEGMLAVFTCGALGSGGNPLIDAPRGTEIQRMLEAFGDHPDEGVVAVARQFAEMSREGAEPDEEEDFGS